MPIQVGLDAVASVYSPFLQSHFYSRSCIALAIAMIAIFYSCYLPQAVNCGRFCFWHRQSAVLFVYETPRETVERLCAKFTRRRGQRPKPPRTKTAFSAACVRFMSGKTSLATSFFRFFSVQISRRHWPDFRKSLSQRGLFWNWLSYVLWQCFYVPPKIWGAKLPIFANLRTPESTVWAPAFHVASEIGKSKTIRSIIG